IKVRVLDDLRWTTPARSRQRGHRMPSGSTRMTLEQAQAPSTPSAVSESEAVSNTRAGRWCTTSSCFRNGITLRQSVAERRSSADAPLGLFRRLTNGLYVVGVAQQNRRDAFTAAWITQVSFDPLVVALSVNPTQASYPILIAANVFAISVLR